MNSSINRRIAGTKEQNRAMALRLIATRILIQKRNDVTHKSEK